jgi:hypothetical protein
VSCTPPSPISAISPAGRARAEVSALHRQQQPCLRRRCRWRLAWVQPCCLPWPSEASQQHVHSCTWAQVRPICCIPLCSRNQGVQGHAHGGEGGGQCECSPASCNDLAGFAAARANSCNREQAGTFARLASLLRVVPQGG